MKWSNPGGRETKNWNPDLGVRGAGSVGAYLKCCVIMSKKNCLDNPEKPSKAFRDALGKRRKGDALRLREQLTPTLLQLLHDYEENGRLLGRDRAVQVKQQLGEAFQNALDGQFEPNPSCSYCAELENLAFLRAQSVCMPVRISPFSPAAPHGSSLLA